jgi:hypothetical protein
MRRAKFIMLLLISLALWFLTSWGMHEVDASPSGDSQGQAHCQQVYDLLIQEDDWYGKLVDPVLTTQDELDQRLWLYQQVHDCLSGDPEARSGELKNVLRLTEYFLIFAGGYGTPEDGSELVLVDLSGSDDEAVVQIREEMGLPAPEGFIYVRMYESRQAMPLLVRRIFENENVAGVTILTRYVAVLAEDKPLFAEQILQRQALPVTTSHELVHAYINSSLGYENLSLYPTWFHEGVAIYFSRSGENHSVVTPGFSMYRTSPEEYQEYNTNFQYLESELGRDRLLTLIQEALANLEPGQVFFEAGIKTDDELFKLAFDWRGKQNNIRLGAGLLVALMLGWGLFRLAPEARCRYCGYAGKRKNFVEGFCPRCGGWNKHLS